MELKDIKLKEIATLKEIGIVKNELNETGRNDCSDILSEIILEKDLAETIIEIEQFSHVIVLYWMELDNWPDRPKTLTVQPRHDPSNPMVGVLAARSPDRPNRIGISVAKVIEHRENVLKISGLDAIDGTSVIDIKPYLPRMDTAMDARISPWETASW